MPLNIWNTAAAAAVIMIVLSKVSTTNAAPTVKNITAAGKVLAEHMLTNRSLEVEPARTPVHGRVIYDVLALSAVCCLASMLASRLKTVWPYRHLLLRSDNVLRLLSLSIPVMGILFIISGSLLLNVWDLNDEYRCQYAIYICLGFYVGQKALEYAFMVERAHQLRMLRRNADYWYMGLMAAVVIGFGAIAVAAFIFPVTGISSIDGQCRIGLPIEITIPLLTYDICLNISLTTMFTVRAKALAKARGFKDVVRFTYQALPFVKPLLVDQNGMLLHQCGRALLGCVAIIAPTVFNLVVLFKLDGHEQGWLCLSICTIDVFWSTNVIHWLTSSAQRPSPSTALNDETRNATAAHALDTLQEV